MDNDKTNKTNETNKFALLTKLLEKVGITPEVLVEKLKEKTSCQQEVTEDQAKKLLETVESCAKSKHTALVMASSEDEDTDVENMVILIKGERKEALALLSLMLCTALKELDISFDKFAEVTKEALEKSKNQG